ncbi:hypothetical protein Xoosp13_38 [Xanthomonas phage Xoo-sp13]|nr:hypothetical protein Xoosp13_38 [Xanthomonas phage Xoo-sp13]
MVDTLSAELQKFPKGPMGLTPDHVKATPEFKFAKYVFDLAFKKLREFNGEFNRKFKAEIKADRRALVKAREAKFH